MLWFFSIKKNILIPNVAEKKYSDFGGGKKNNLIHSFYHGKFWNKNFALWATKKYSNSCVVRQKISERKKSEHAVYKQ